ncbi:MAG: hypothetical protein ABFD60_11790 [Bryobacteraceae bacterium]
MFTTEVLPPGQISLATWYDRSRRNPGDLTVSTFGFGGAVGVTKRIEFSLSFDAHRHVLAGRPDQLSFGQQALGYFGDKTPGSSPLASELMPDSSLAPQLRSPAGPDGSLTGAAGYYNLLPFVGLVRSAGAAGSFSSGVKVKILSETNGAPFGFAVRPYVDVPVHKAVAFLLTHPVGTADLQFGFDGIVSRSIGDAAELYWNAGYRHISQPAHASVFRLASVVPLGFGLVLPRTARLQLIAESTAEVFVGDHTPNTTAGPETPVDVTIGFRAHLPYSFNLSAGYRRPVNPSAAGKDGFVVSLGYNSRLFTH